MVLFGAASVLHADHNYNGQYNACAAQRPNQNMGAVYNRPDFVPSYSNNRQDVGPSYSYNRPPMGNAGYISGNTGFISGDTGFRTGNTYYYQDSNFSRPGAFADQQIRMNNQSFDNHPGMNPVRY